MMIWSLYRIGQHSKESKSHERAELRLVQADCQPESVRPSGLASGTVTHWQVRASEPGRSIAMQGRVGPCHYDWLTGDIGRKFKL